VTPSGIKATDGDGDEITYSMEADSGEYYIEI